MLSAVSQVATPIPWREVLDHGIDVSCVLIYEQWGWPFAPEKLNSFLERSKIAAVVIDRVDTASLKQICRIKACYEIWSLSKVLGLQMGGLARTPDGGWLKWCSKAENTRTVDCNSTGAFDAGLCINRLELLKSYGNSICHGVAEVIRNINLEKSFEAEGMRRRIHAEYLSSALGHVALAERLLDGGAPGIYPFGLNLSRQELLQAQSLMNRLNIESRIYNFNTSNDPNNPAYGECLALPIHSGISMERLEDVAKVLS